MKRLIAKEDNTGTILEIAWVVRDEVVSKYGEDFLYGKCIEASERIVGLLKEKGIDAQTVEGWCVYDDSTTVSDRPYDEHTWVESNCIYIDVTATQFGAFVGEEIPEIIVGSKPDYMVYDEPTHLIEEDY